jgi:plasmid stability protein
MAQLIVRNIEDDVKDRLVQRARRHGHSMEEEVRTILRQVVGEDRKAAPDIGLGTRLARHFAAYRLVLDLPEIGAEEARPAIFE